MRRKFEEVINTPIENFGAPRPGVATITLGVVAGNVITGTAKMIGNGLWNMLPSRAPAAPTTPAPEGTK